jgi:hypothetical protein
VRLERLGERGLPLPPFYDGAEWHVWVDDGTQWLTSFRVADHVAGLYFAREPAAERDGVLDIIDFFFKHGSFEDVMPFLDGLRHDIFDLAAVLWKLEVMFDGRHNRQLPCGPRMQSP